MAAYISSSSTPKINWAAQDMSLEYLNFEDMCEMMFYGPLAEHRDNDKAKFSYMSLWGGPKALELFHNSALCNQKTRKNLLLVLKDYCNDNELYNELSCNKGTFDDEILYFLGKADQDNVCNEDIIAKSDSDDLSANNSPDNINIYHSSSSMITVLVVIFTVIIFLLAKILKQIMAISLLVETLIMIIALMMIITNVMKMNLC